MKKLKLFFACLLMAVLSIGQVWATSPKAYTFSSDDGVTNVNMGDGFYFTTAKGSGNNTNPTFNNGARVYASGTLTIWYSGSDDVKITQIVYNFKQNQGGSSGNKAYPGISGVAGSTNAGSTSTTGSQGQNQTLTWSDDDGDTEVVFTLDGTKGNITFTSVTITYEVTGGSTCSSEITITKADNPSNGTFVIDNSGTVCIDEGNATVNVTATPVEHYHLASVTTTGSVGTIGSIAGNTCEITDIDADTEIGVTFAEDTKCVVTWNVNGNEDTKTNVYAGEKPVFPATPAACDATSTTFIGWATAPWTGKLADLSEKTVYTSASAMPDVDAAVTYYAVFAKSSGSASNLFSWAGGTKEELTAAEGVADLNADNSDYADTHAPYRVKWNGTGKYIIISVASQPGQVSAGFKMIGGGTTSTITVQEADDAEGQFTDVENLAISGSSNDVVNIESTQAFKSTTRAIKLYYTKGSNVGLGPISIEGAVTYEDYMTTCCTKYNVNIAAGITNGSVSADPASACEGATITLTFTPALNYHLSAWTLNGDNQDIAENTFTMPGEAVTISATFAEDACDPLGTPSVTVSGKAYPYNAVKLAWTAIDNADKYKVYIYDNDDNELEHNDAFAGVEYTIGQTLEAGTTYKYSVQAISNTPATYCPSTEAESTFATDALPTAHLTLIDLEGEHASSGDYTILTPFALPTTAASCAKTFYGWTATENYSSESVAPEYKAGDNFTFLNTTGATLYAVYADEVTPGAISYNKVTNTASITNGDYLFVYEDENVAFDGNLETLDAANNGVSVTISESVIAGSDGVNAAVFTLDVTNGTVKAHSGDYIGVSTYGNGLKQSATATYPAHTFTVDENGDAIISIYGATWNSGGPGYMILNYNKGTSDKRFRYYKGGSQQKIQLYKKTVGEGVYGNYTTSCVAAPTATPASSSIEVDAAGANSTLGVTYENVNLAAVGVALYNNAACTEDFDGGWLTANIDGEDKHIAYTITENTSYNDARTAYIKLTAPEASGATAPATAIITVTQAKKAAVFASLEELVAADVNVNTEVTVSFSNVVIKEIYMYNSNRRGLTFNIQKDAADIKIYFNADVPAEWVAGGTVSGTLTNCPWKIYSGAWQLAPSSGWAWNNGDLSYTAPKAVSSVVVSGAPSKTTYVDGELFKPAGLTVTVNYTVGEPEVNPVGVTFTCDPERVAKGNTSVEVIATFNEVDSDPFEVTGLTVGDIQLKTVQEFITAGNADMRCYLEGTVSNYTNTTKGYFDLTDASGTIYIYGCDAPSSFAAGDKIKVIAEDYDYYNFKHEAKNVQFVSKTSPVDITITSGSTVEKGKTLTLTATTDPAAAIDHISYSVKVDGNEGNVSLSDNVLTGVEVGEATIIASIPDGEGYIANSVEFTVEVTPAIVHASITYVENGANEDIDDVADATALPDPLPTVTKDNFLFGGWYTDAEFNTPAVAGAALSEDVTLYAKWNAIPYYATVYTSNVDFVGGGNSHENNSKVVINTVEYKAQKVGASSNTGTVTVIVPAYTHTLHFHVFTWKDRANVLSISSDDVTNLSASTIDVNGDAAGAASTPYTINSNPVDHYQYITFDPIATEAEITFSWSSGTDKRFVMYGINQEGGVLPELDHIVITGNASTTEYEAGDEFDPAGLGVNAIYTLADVEQDPVAVDAADIEWSFDPAVLTGETSSVTVTATYEGKQANKNVNVTVTVPTTPEILATPDAINFGTVNQNAEVDAQGISVTLKAVAAATVTLAGDGAAAFSIDKAALSELNSTITVTPVTTATGTFAATVTISDDADAADDVVINLSMTVEAVEDLSGTWVKATSVAAGDRIIIGATVSAGTKTMGKQNSNPNRAAVASTLADGVLTPGEGTKTFLVVDAGDGKFALQALNGKYLTSATEGTGNNLLEAANYENDNAKWTITIDGEGVASVVAAAGSRTYMKYNNGSTLFSCYQYETSQSPINIYKKGTPDYGSYQRDVTNGNYGTICLPKAGAISGAKLFEVAYRGDNVIYCDEILTGEMEAGHPYIFQATSEQLNVAYSNGNALVAASDANGLYGFYDLENMATDEAAHKDLTQDAGNYILYNNQYWLVSGRAAYINNFRAYIKLDEISTSEPTPTPGAAPRRRVAMNVNGAQTATGMDELNASETPVKVMIDGQLFILCGDKMFDATGRLVK